MADMIPDEKIHETGLAGANAATPAGTEKQPEETPVAAPTAEDMQQAALEAARTAVAEAAAAQPKGLSEDDITKLLDKQRAQIAQAVSGAPAEAQPDPALTALVNDTTGTLGKVGEVIRKQIMDELQENNSQLSEVQTAYGEVLSERPDVTGGAEAREAFMAYYGMTDEEQPQKKRFTEALKKYDLFMEAAGVGSAEDRITKAQGITKSQAATGGRVEDPNAKPELEQMQDELAQRATRRGRLQKGVFIPAT